MNGATAGPAIDLGPGAEELLAGLGAPVSKAVALRSVAESSRPPCYRVHLADGRTVKLRRAASAARARDYARLIQDLADPRLARVLDCRHDLTLEEWVPGTSLEAIEPRDEHVIAGAALLGSLHATTRLGNRPVKRTASTRSVLEVLNKDLRAFLGAGKIDRSLAQRIRALARRYDPGAAITGVIHTDLCPENLVVDPHGVLRAVDNEWICVGSMEFDLARVWYRWPMPDPEWRTFLKEYSRFSDPEPALAHFQFWKIAAICKSARARLALPGDRTDAPLRHLASFTAGED